MSDVTVPGTGGNTVTWGFSNSNNLSLAQQIANALAAAASTAGGLTFTTASVPGAVPPPPDNTVKGGANELIIPGDVGNPLSYTIPGGSATAPDYTVVLDNDGPVTIFAAPNVSVVGGNTDVTVVGGASVVMSEEAGNANVQLSQLATGGVVVGNNQNDTLIATGFNQSVAGGEGANLLMAVGLNDTISATGSGDTLSGGLGAATYLIDSTASSEIVFGQFGVADVDDQGQQDTVVGSSGETNVAIGGSSSWVYGGSGALNAIVSGDADTIVGGTSAANVTLFGSNAVVFGGLGSLSAVDFGSGDTIVAGLGFTAVTAGGGAFGSFVYGEAGLLNFVGGAAGSTVVGGSGNATITGGDGTITLFGGAGGAIDFGNAGAGSLVYAAGSGNETLDASASTSDNQLFGGADPSGQNVIMAGTGTDTLVAGQGAATLTGGDGSDLFVFFAANGAGGPRDVIGDFTAADTVLLSDYGPDAAATALANATTSDGATTITLSDNTKITFTNATPDQLTGHIVST